MILKMRICQYQFQKYSLGWELISEITSFRYSKISKEEKQNKELHLNSCIESLDNNGRVDIKNNDYIYVQAWHKRSAEPLNIISNMLVYMLNDEGKTIERLH